VTVADGGAVPPSPVAWAARASRPATGGAEVTARQTWCRRPDAVTTAGVAAVVGVRVATTSMRDVVTTMSLR
jgi:hypothetical protein